jgi:uroporphyrinogen-III synthase
MRALAVLRPEPGNAVTAAAVEARGLVAIRLPLFAVRPIAWTSPGPAGFDALLVTSANALRHGGPGLAALRHLPVLAVGEATAEAARAAGFTVERTGVADAAALVAGEPRRLLHLAGRDRVAVPGTEAVAVYAADVLPADARALAGSVALLHSARAARRLRMIAPGDVVIAALSPAVAAAAGDGWTAVHAARAPTDAALLDLAETLAD